MSKPAQAYEPEVPIEVRYRVELRDPRGGDREGVVYRVDDPALPGWPAIYWVQVNGAVVQCVAEELTLVEDDEPGGENG